MANVNETEEANRVGSAIKLMEREGFLTDATVAAADTVAGVIAAINAVTLGSNQSETQREKHLKAITAGEDLGLLTDAGILSLTTVQGLADLTGVPASFSPKPFWA